MLWAEENAMKAATQGSRIQDFVYRNYNTCKALKKKYWDFHIASETHSDDLRPFFHVSWSEHPIPSLYEKSEIMRMQGFVLSQEHCYAANSEKREEEPWSASCQQ